MFHRIAAIPDWLRRLGASWSDLSIEHLALRQQLAILTAKRPRPRMPAADRFFRVAFRRFWPRWKPALAIIQPDTAVRWHRCGGRPSTTAEIRAWVRRMAASDGGPLPTAYFWRILVCMRTTLILNDTLLREAQRLTGLGEKTAVVHAGLEALIARESARRLAALGGSQPRLRSIPRRRPKKNG